MGKTSTTPSSGTLPAGPTGTTSPVTVRSLKQAKDAGRRVTMLTVYDYPTARLLDQAGIDMLLVGDSLGMVVQGHTTTVPVTLSEMIYHGRMVARAAQRSMVVVDLPFPVGQLGVRDTLRKAARVVKQTGCQAVKLEGGAAQADTIAALVDAGIATIAHIGLRPQSVHALGGYRVQRDRDRLMQDAEAAVRAGAFAILLECVPEAFAREVTQMVPVPTIGIGAGAGCDGQVLVLHDMLGLGEGRVPKFVRQYANLRSVIDEAVRRYRDEVIAGTFPGAPESFE